MEFMPITTSGKAHLAVALHLDEPAERGQEEEADAAAEQRPGGRPDALHDRADAGEVEQQAGRADERRQR